MPHRPAYSSSARPPEANVTIARADVGQESLREALASLQSAYRQREGDVLHALLDADGLRFQHELESAAQTKYKQRAALLTRDHDPIAAAIDAALQHVERAGKLMRRMATDERA